MPAQSGITSTTPETYWSGALSNWAIDCVKNGYEVETLPYNGTISYGNTSNSQDLSNYTIYIVDEPNILFTAAEKSAILNFVNGGGSLFMISDHDQSDRNFDNFDSPAIWNDLLSGAQTGITFNIDDFSQTSTSVINTGADSITNGRYGNVTQVLWTDGTDMTIDTAENTTVRGAVFKNGFSGNASHVLFAYAHYGNGKIAAISDSSPCDDGTGDVNDNLYNGYTLDANGNHRRLLMNATVWLAQSMSTTVTLPDTKNIFNIYSFGHSIGFRNNSAVSELFFLYDNEGKEIQQIVANPGLTISAAESFAAGIYFARSRNYSARFMVRN